jgi:hypothetical protein
MLRYGEKQLQAKETSRAKCLWRKEKFQEANLAGAQ